LNKTNENGIRYISLLTAIANGIRYISLLTAIDTFRSR